MKTANLNALRVFATVAEHGNLQRAAEVLNLSRGAVSQRIRQLEIDLGAVLLVRGARGVSLTLEGARCHAAMTEALAILEPVLDGIAQRPDRITLHIGPSTVTKWLMPRMRDFASRFPALSLTTEVHERPLDRALGRNEIAIWPGRAQDANPANLTRHLTDIRLVAVCSPALARPGGVCDTATLLRLPLLQDAHRRWDRLIEATGHRGRARLYNFDRSALALDAAIGGHGVAIAPDYMVRNDLSAGRLVVLRSEPDPPGSALLVSWSKTHTAPARAARVIDWIAEGF